MARSQWSSTQKIASRRRNKQSLSMQLFVIDIELLFPCMQVVHCEA